MTRSGRSPGSAGLDTAAARHYGPPAQGSSEPAEGRTMRRLTRGCGLGLVLAAGCIEHQPQVLPTNGAPPGWSAKPVNAPPGSTEAAARVDAVGRQVLAANPQVGAKPLF